MIALLLIASGAASATTISCSSEKQLAGTYKTSVAAGFTPNILSIVVGAGSEYKVHLSSYWEPKPFDNGQRGTVGDFGGMLTVPTPWSCTAFLYVAETGVADGERGAVCVLALRFVDTKHVHINGMGQCDYFHGHNAYPNGLYILQDSK
jgi:hypothetical protein